MKRSGAEVRPEQTPPVPTGPFGYAFLSPMDTPFEQPPALPPGLPLLDDNESSMLDNFFSTMNTNNLANDFWLRGHHDKPPGLDFGWNQELPPTFEGSTTSLSQSSFVTPNSKANVVGGGDTNADIYAAASLLFPNETHGGHLSPALAQQTFTGQPLNLGVAHGRRDSRNPVHAVASSSSSSRPRIPTGFHTSEMLFDVRDPIPVDQHPSRKARGLHWGSDGSFMDQGYVAPPDQPDMETRTRELLGQLDCFEPQDSAATTRAPSPERTTQSNNTSAAHHSTGDENDSHPRKRQRTIKGKSDSPSEDEESRSQPNKSRSSSIAKGRRASTDGFRKARVIQAAKATRENLSEEQKRTNHILSEQKRRNLIRQGFDDLCSLVPSLRGGGFSKSAMLTQAADWLEDLLRGNELLRSQLTDMKSINGLVMPR
ncbi:Basic-region helix-loop-helix (bHLH) transcription factor [Penicillium ucsense]|uniref:Basic-region helix-loop-helix (BHLH) transcription factor n=1 Tax=Penicillium ucsense TaxID=2839758 RepID=A0A8J8WG88_9EURO|nr:Basic-region helix-loop-helix (bHLH) transcription factor [Penicillium ucsense]KAF7736770.1 Basic-region helix-loop-helix (bHLH) transcription factor [Penicillium ucsense]